MELEITLEHDFWRVCSAIFCFVTGIHCLASIPGRQLQEYKTVIVSWLHAVKYILLVPVYALISVFSLQVIIMPLFHFLETREIVRQKQISILCESHNIKELSNGDWIAQSVRWVAESAGLRRLVSRRNTFKHFYFPSHPGHYWTIYITKHSFPGSKTVGAWSEHSPTSSVEI